MGIVRWRMSHTKLGAESGSVLEIRFNLMLSYVGNIQMKQLIPISLLIFLPGTDCPLFAVCTATEMNADYAEKSSLQTGPVTSSKNVPISAQGDLVMITAWCHNPSNSPGYHCTVSAPTLGGVPATMAVSGIPSDGKQDSGVYSGTGQGWIYYIPATTAGQVGSSVPLSLTATIAGGNNVETQVSYMEFHPSAGCAFLHHIDYPLGTSLDPNTGLDNGHSTALINAPVFTPTAEDLLFDFMYTTEHIAVIGSPWHCVIYPGISGANNTCNFNNTINSQAYALSATANSTNPNTTINAVNNWQALVTSFELSSSTPAPNPPTLLNATPE